MAKRKSVVYSSILSIFIVSAVYLFFNIAFTHTIWNQVLYPEKADQIIIQGESPVYEYAAEIVRQNILSGNNPFQSTEFLLYPFGWNFSLEDVAPINGFYFLLLRPFLQIHQSMMLITVLNIFLSNVIMYLLLRYLGLRKDVSFLGGFLFGFTPWVALRIGAYPSYTALYVFPLITYLLLSLIQSQKHKTLRAIVFGIVLAITLLTNLYFTVMVTVLSVVSFIIFLIFYKNIIISILKINAKYLFIACTTAVILLIPWMSEAYKAKVLIQYPNPPSWTDSIAFSADVFNIILPSYANPFYKPFLGIISKAFPHAQKGIFESFIYPGIIILFGYALIFYYWRKQGKNIKVLVLISLGMLTLTLGPFLQVYGKILYIPLPYIILQSIPYFELARSPGRFIILFIFLACIVISLAFNKVLNKLKKKSQIIIFSAVFLIAVVDFSFQGGPPGVLPIPNKIFSFLKNGPNHFSVLNIPFTIRDGLQSLGYYHGVGFPRTQLLINKPYFSAYAGRISDDTFQYYNKNPLFKLFDKAINAPNPNYKSLFDSADINQLDRIITFLNIDYITLNTQEKYYPFAREFFKKLKYTDIFFDKEYLLMYRKNNPDEFFPESLYLTKDQLFFEQGWSPPIQNGRWITGHVGTVLFKVQKPKKVFLHFRAKSVDEPQKVDLYINKKYVQNFLLSNGFKNHNLVLDSHIKPGINIITLRFPHVVEPAKVLPNNQDKRKLTAYFANLNISNKQNKIAKIKADYLSITFDKDEDEHHLLEGWSDYEKGARWIEGKSAKVEFSIKNAKPKKIILTAEALYKPQITKVYVNDTYIGTLKIDSGKTDSYSLNIENSFKKGTNIISFQFSHAERIGKLTNTNDLRLLSTYVKSIKLL